MSKGPLGLLPHSAKSIIGDLRFLVFLLILSGFLLVSGHLFGEWLLHFVDNWVDMPEWSGDFLAEYPQAFLSWAALPAIVLLPVIAWVIWKRNILQIVALGMLRVCDEITVAT
ncbi:MAG: hypothetical protein KAY37_01205 [Phycisphaerae bacterium]|nr:hypothetical protein [Phycisphaerae bacterium]